jgi:phosphoadenosine phosphosulfate reductase
MKREDGEKLSVTARDMSAEDLLRHFLGLFSAHTELGPGNKGKDTIALASSLGAEDQVLTHMILMIKPDARIFLLDTGRLHPETYELMAATMKRYDMHYEVLFPEASDVEEMESIHGPNLFYAGVEHRKRCCHVRKVKPLRRILSTLDAWITGLRKEQAVTRSSIHKVEWDEANGLIKLNPLADWSVQDVWNYIKAHDIPYNKLHDCGYPSIGCAPCTRATLPGEDVRAGRWWWEKPEQRECGLHVVEGKLVRRTS